MATALLTVILTFIFTGLLSTRIVHALQHRNWLIQQRLHDTEKTYSELHNTFNEVAGLANRRHFRMLRLLSAIESFDIDRVKGAVKDYDETVIAWNERLTILYAKLTMQLSHALTNDLEHHVQQAFYEEGLRLEAMARKRISGGVVERFEISETSKGLRQIQVDLGRFYKNVLRFIDEKKKSLYAEPAITEWSLDRVPTWELLKALFKPG